ncbi:hypothetical protein KA005_25395 [bacterium]|nr:hypothetical protein [bacterium]
MTENFESLELNSIEVIAAIHQFEGEYKSRIAAIKEAVTGIYRSYKKREETIANNADRFTQDAVADKLYNLRKSVRQSLEELVRGRGFFTEIEACRTELEKDEVKNDIQQLIQTMKEIELRKLMRESDNFPNAFMGEITSGDPLTISALENSPAGLPIEDGILKDGQKRRLEVLKPVVAKRFHLLQEAQGVIEGMANAVMPIKAGDIDPLRDILEED